MKKISCLLAFTLAISFAFAQKSTRLNGYANYVFDDSYSSLYDSYNYYNGTINGGVQWGVGFEFMLQPTVCLELMWLNQATHAPTTYQTGPGTSVKNENFDLSINYAMLGADKHMPLPNGKSELYGGIFAGVAFMNLKAPSSGRSSSAEKFAWQMRFGFIYWAAAKVGIKLQAQLTSIAQGAGGGFYFGTGGVGAGVSTYSSMYQFGLGGGLTFKVGH
jgi:hypothetical protein